MDGPSIARATEHGPRRDRAARRARTARSTRRCAPRIAALGAAHVQKGVRRQAREAVEDYFYNRLGLSPEHAAQPPRAAPADARADARRRCTRRSRTSSSSSSTASTRSCTTSPARRCEVEDLRRRVEDDCPEALVLPPREHYGIEAIMKSDEPGDQGWALLPGPVDRGRPGAAAPRGRAGPVRRPLPRHAHRHPAVTPVALIVKPLPVAATVHVIPRASDVQRKPPSSTV